MTLKQKGVIIVYNNEIENYCRHPAYDRKWHTIENIKGGNTGEKGGYYFFSVADDPDSQFSGMWSGGNS